MSKKRAIHILNCASQPFTSRHNALRWIEQGRARYIDELTIEMVEDHPRHKACIASIGGASSRATIAGNAAPRSSPSGMPVIDELPDAFLGQTYLHYPQAA